MNFKAIPATLVGPDEPRYWFHSEGAARLVLPLMKEWDADLHLAPFEKIMEHVSGGPYRLEDAWAIVRRVEA